MVNAIIIDDELNARENLILLLNKYCKNIEVIGEANSVESGINILNNCKPDVVFLDIALGNSTGFDLLLQLSDIQFELIFVTAYDQYALNAIKFSALDYLLKPISIKDLTNAYEKLEKKLSIKKFSDLSILLEIIKKPNNQDNRIVIPCMDGLEVVSVNNIYYCESDGDYTYLYMNDNIKITSSYNIGEYQSMLEHYNFFRVHHSFLVNKNHIKKYLKGDGGSIEMMNHKILPISRRKKIEFVNWLKTIE